MTSLPDISTLTETQLRELPARRTAVLTVNNRLARRLIQSLATQLASKQRPGSSLTLTAEIPMVVPWSGWLAHLFNQLSFKDLGASYAYALDAFAAQTLWAQVIEECEPEERVLLDINQAAASAMQADALLDEWEIVVPEGAETEEYSSFLRWRDRYRERLHAIDAVDPNTLVLRLMHHLSTAVKQAGASIASALPSDIVLTGFSELSPRMAGLLDRLQELGVKIHVLQQPELPTAHISRVKAANAQEEWLAAAYWARSKLEQNPQASLAIVATGLDRDVAYARRVLERVLTPAGFAFNVAVARPLADWDAGRALLAWLRTFVLMKTQQWAEPADLGAALLAGHCIGHLSEKGARARVDVRWRDFQTTRLTMTAWVRSIEALTQLSPAWLRAWQDWSSQSTQAEPHQWAKIFRSTLATLGFPGEAQQSSVAYQVTEALDALLDRFAALPPVLGRIGAMQAWSVLSRMARSASFQPQRDAASRLDVLGLLEAEGGRWDAVWMLGLTDEAMPATASPNPFIPLAAQRLAKAPRATPERELEWAQHIYRHLCQTAPEVIVSAPGQDGERGLRPSPLIASVTQIGDGWTPSDEKPVPAVMQELLDETGPVLMTNEVTRGGVGVLELQARNPLWAFVRHRLGVRGLEAYATQPSGALRGIFLHALMQAVWEQLGDQEQLHASMLRADFTPWLETLTHEIAEKKLHEFPEILRKLEARRALSLLAKWLELEAQRMPFAVIEIEQDRMLQIGGLKLMLRLDRLDRLLIAGDERQVVIDYKSGAELPKVLKDWRQPRPSNLQLPSYAALLNAEGKSEALAGLVLVQLHTKAMGAEGLVREDIGLEGPKTIAQTDFADESWPQVMQGLCQSVEALADEFVRACAVNQSWTAQDLKYCDVLPILRLFDAGSEQEENENE